MPYIDQTAREHLDRYIDSMPVSVAEPGELNYAITRILLRAVGDPFRMRYRDIMTVLGTLECVKAEFYRRIAVPYEQQKMAENGDVY